MTFADRIRIPFAVAVLAATTFAPGTARAESVRVIVPDGDNLQYLTFWVAKGAGYFRDEGVTLEMVVPEIPKATRTRIEKGDCDAFVLPPPTALELAAADDPVVLVATLLANDPINLVVRDEIVRQRGIDPRAPLADRLRKLSGLRIGVAPGPPPRLRALFDSVGMDVDKEATVVVVSGHDQNAAFAGRQVDALYAHTPYMEKALLDQGATLIVNQSGGEFPSLATRQIHTLGVSRKLRDERPDTVAKLVRAVTRAASTIHRSKEDARRAVLAEFPSMDPRHVALLVDTYEPAIPTTLHVSAERLRAAIPLFPPSRASLDPDGIAFARYVDDSFVTRDERGPRTDPFRSARPAPVDEGPAGLVGRAFTALAALGALVGAVTLGGSRRR
ncbi:MAG: ABC transporter substrate-binding protein [Polyangiaceae bacterium]